MHWLMKQLSCEQCRERWDELIHKSTLEADSQSADVRAHLENCADCRKDFELLIAAKQELQQLPPQKAPASLRANILNEIEKSREHHLPWWHAFLVAPQRLAWASGAIAAVFLVALLMRPEHQIPITPPAPKVLSNRAQVEQQNQIQAQPRVVPSPVEKRGTQKATPEKPKTKSAANSSAHEKNVPERNVGKSRQPQKIKAMPELPHNLPAPSAAHRMAAPAKMPFSHKDKAEKQAAVDAGQFAPQAAARNDFAPKETAKSAAGFAKPSPQNFAGQQDSMNRSMKTAESIHAFEAHNSPGIIHWSKVITSDYDVANAKISVTLQEGLAFADESQKDAERALWQGTLFRGKQIPLDVDLRHNSTRAAKLHLVMIDTDTQKVLLDKIFDVQ